jgi:hypothetical protein
MLCEEDAEMRYAWRERRESLRVTSEEVAADRKERRS